MGKKKKKVKVKDNLKATWIKMENKWKCIIGFWHHSASIVPRLYVTFSLSKEIAGFVPIFTSTKIVVSLSDTSPQNKIAILQDRMECTKAVRVYHALGMMYLTM